MSPQDAQILGAVLGVPAVFLLALEEEERLSGENELTLQELTLLRNYRELDQVDKDRASITLEVMAIQHRTPHTHRSPPAPSTPTAGLSRPETKKTTPS